VSDVSKMPTTGGCPWCGLGFSVDWNDAGPNGEATGAIYHELPLCKKYMELTGDEFVQAVLDGKHRS
jgi:hypothetical protein